MISIHTEGSGTIIRDGGATNLNGAAVWNGTEWVVNNTWAHQYFIDSRDGKRVKTYDQRTVEFQGSQSGTSTHWGYSVVRSRYEYQKATAKGVYRFAATEYRVTDPAGKRVVLRSRGTGAGTANPYFDIYLEDENGQATALRGDPVWFTYPSLDQALQQTSATAGRTGSFPSAPADYFLDIGGGSDLGPSGVGKSFQFHTAALTVPDSGLSLGSSFATDFNLKWMDGQGQLGLLRFLPWAEGSYTPNVPAGPAITAVLHGASFAAVIAPNSFVSIFGTNLAAAQANWDSAIPDGRTLPGSLGNVRVKINGKDCWINFVSATQINVLSPADPGAGSVTVEVITPQGSATRTATLAQVAPGFFCYTLGGKSRLAALFGNTAIYVAPAGALPGVTSRPARARDILQLYAGGLGATAAPAPQGQVLTAAYPIDDLGRIQVTINGVRAPVHWAGLTFAGLFQVNVEVPAGLPAGDLPVILTVNGQSTQADAVLTFEL